MPVDNDAKEKYIESMVRDGGKIADTKLLRSLSQSVRSFGDGGIGGSYCPVTASEAIDICLEMAISKSPPIMGGYEGMEEDPEFTTGNLRSRLAWEYLTADVEEALVFMPAGLGYSRGPYITSVKTSRLVGELKRFGRDLRNRGDDNVEVSSTWFRHPDLVVITHHLVDKYCERSFLYGMNERFYDTLHLGPKPST